MTCSLTLLRHHNPNNGTLDRSSWPYQQWCPQLSYSDGTETLWRGPHRAFYLELMKKRSSTLKTRKHYPVIKKCGPKVNIHFGLFLLKKFPIKVRQGNVKDLKLTGRLRAEENLLRQKKQNVSRSRKSLTSTITPRPVSEPIHKSVPGTLLLIVAGKTHIGMQNSSWLLRPSASMIAAWKAWSSRAMAVRGVPVHHVLRHWAKGSNFRDMTGRREPSNQQGVGPLGSAEPTRGLDWRLSRWRACHNYSRAARGIPLPCPSCPAGRRHKWQSKGGAKQAAKQASGQGDRGASWVSH